MNENFYKTAVEQHTLGVDDFQDIFGVPLSNYMKEKINEYNFIYEDVSIDEHNSYIRKIVEVLLDPVIVKAGEHRREDWEKGWGENLRKITTASNALLEATNPQYFSKYSILRWKQRFIKPMNKYFERNSLAIILDWLFDRYFRDASAVYEFGCGTGHNLLHLREVNSKAKLYGLDWAKSSQKIIEELVRKKIANNMYAHQFDYFSPDINFKLEKDSIVFTVASLEQIGNRFDAFLSYIFENRPQLCIHVEPIAELLDPSNLLDFLSIQYFIKRNYLDGFLTRLRELEKSGHCKIHQTQRTFIGSFFIEGYSIVIWSPNVK
jgi:hypothetical protein